MITFIWAEAENGVIGIHGELPWHNQKGDMHHFRKMTLGHVILSGKKTFYSYHMKAGLPHRKNLVLSARLKRLGHGVTLFHSLKDFLYYAKSHPNENIMVCGGHRVFKELRPYVDFLQRTVIKHSFDGDTYAVPINYKHFTLIHKEDFPSDENNEFPYEFQTWTHKFIPKKNNDKRRKRRRRRNRNRKKKRAEKAKKAQEAQQAEQANQSPVSEDRLTNQPKKEKDKADPNNVSPDKLEQEKLKLKKMLGL